MMNYAMNNALYVRRRKKALLPPVSGAAGAETPLAPAVIAALAVNVGSLGYVLSPALLEACQSVPLAVLTPWYESLAADLQKLRGAHQVFKPFYPNFPEQVMKTGEVELYFNALVHYWSEGKWKPRTPKNLRPALDETTPAQKIELGTQSEFDGLFTQIAGANASLSVQDRDDLAWFIANYQNDVLPLVPENVPQKENAAVLSALLFALLNDKAVASDFAQTQAKTATDVLRLAVALCPDGDISLAAPTKFRTFSRPERRFLLDLVNRQKNPVEDMLRWKNRWIRLGEKLHPGEMKARYPVAFDAFQILRNDVPVQTFNSGLEAALRQNNAPKAVSMLGKRPGDFARRLDHLLRLSPSEQTETLAAFAEAASSVSTPVLLQVRQHFADRSDAPDIRVFFPKGQLAKAHAEPNNLPPLSQSVCNRVVAACETALIVRFSELAPLGSCFLDETLKNYPVPFAARSASKSLRTLARGTRLPLPPDCRVLRFFVWWKNGTERTDIDLSAALFNADFEFMNVLAYYNLKNFGGVHSGDIVDAPDGASEFIDVDLAKTKAENVRYIVMTLHSFTQQPYKELPECFAGWMARKKAGSGEVYDPKTVVDRLDITAEAKIAVPLLIDIETGKVVWCDMSLTSAAGLQNNVASSQGGIAATLRALVSVRKPNLWDLFRLHIAARGKMAASQEEAETVFSVEGGTPFEQEKIAAEFLA